MLSPSALREALAAPETWWSTDKAVGICLDAYNAGLVVTSPSGKTYEGEAIMDLIASVD